MLTIVDILVLIKKIIKNSCSNQIDYSLIRQKIQDTIQDQLLVTSGKVINSNGTQTDEFQILIVKHQKSAPRATSIQEYDFHDVIFCIELFDEINLPTLQNKLSQIKLLRSLNLNPIAQLGKKGFSLISQIINNLSTDDIEFNNIFPYTLISIQNLKIPNDTPIQLFQNLFNITKDLTNDQLPDEIIIYNQNAQFFNPRLDGKYEFTIGWSYLTIPKSFIPCFICKRPIFRKHFFYNQLCQTCGDLNYLKRIQIADLRGRIAIVTGARIRIGYATALRLLRTGAQVIAITRFPHNAAERYAREPDFDFWKSHLDIYGLDFRDLKSVWTFIQFFTQKYSHLDILINNAAQTVRHPAAYYNPLIAFECENYKNLPENLRPLLSKKHEFQNNPIPAGIENEKAIQNFTMQEMPSLNSAELTQVPVIDEDFQEIDDEIYPSEKIDQSGEQLDLRLSNSWVQHLPEISLPEILEVQLINQIVPTLLVSQLKSCMEKSPWRDRYIINVSSAEGQFSLVKEGVHPHTSIAKAALNMLTFSCANDYDSSGIFITSVDPGWVSEQYPLHGPRRNRKFGLDLQDAASRLCDPIFLGVNYKIFLRGIIIKHYKRSKW